MSLICASATYPKKTNNQHPSLSKPKQGGNNSVRIASNSSNIKQKKNNSVRIASNSSNIKQTA
jgi:hypothetical protein